MVAAACYDLVIIGGGLSGLALAAQLKDTNLNLCLLEASPHLGGRAKTVPYHGLALDNGQHIFHSAYTGFLSILQSVDAPLRAEALTFPKALYTPYHSFGNALHLLRVYCALRYGRFFQAQPDESAAAWLTRLGAQADLLQHFWNPLILAATCTPLSECSATFWQAILKTAFIENSGKLLLPLDSLADSYVHPLAQAIAPQVPIIHQRALSVQQISTGFRVEGTQHSLLTTQVVLATHPYHAAKLLEGLAGEKTKQAQLASLTYAPILTYYFSSAAKSSTLPPLSYCPIATGTESLDAYIVKPTSDTAQRIAVVISGPRNTDAKTLLPFVLAALEKLSLALTAKDCIAHFEEKKGGLLCTKINQLIRKQLATNNHGPLWLCGDYLQPHLPATFEAAAQSAIEVAQKICFQAQQEPQLWGYGKSKSRAALYF